MSKTLWALTDEANKGDYLVTSVHGMVWDMLEVIYYKNV